MLTINSAKEITGLYIFNAEDYYWHPCIGCFNSRDDWPSFNLKTNKNFYLEETDFWDLLTHIPDRSSLIALPNVWTEVDNLLHQFNGTHKQLYIEKITDTIKQSSERYIESWLGTEQFSFMILV